jgi:hypothetical protein
MQWKVRIDVFHVNFLDSQMNFQVIAFCHDGVVASSMPSPRFTNSIHSRSKHHALKKDTLRRPRKRTNVALQCQYNDAKAAYNLKMTLLLFL